MDKYLIKDKSQISITVSDINDILEYNLTNGDLYVSISELGFAVFTKKDLKKGDYVYTFKGEIIDYLETKLINDDTGECRALQFDKDKYINTNAPGRYINHSCEPNTGIKNTFELIALEDIPAHSELRFDYSTTMDEDDFTMPCFCGKSSCRNKVDDFKNLPEEKKIEYIGKEIVMDFIKEQFSSKI